MLVQLQEIKEYLKLASTTHDALLNNLNERSQSLVERIINSKLDLQTIYKLYIINNKTEILLDENNIESISLISDDVDVTNKTYSNTITEYFTDIKTGLIHFVNELENDYLYIEYKTHITDPGIKEIILTLIAKKYYDIDQKRYGVNAKNLMGESITFSYSDITKENREYLKRYRKHPGTVGLPTTRFTHV